MVFVLFLAILGLCPLAFGSVDFWPRATLEIFCPLIAGLYFFPYPQRKTLYNPPGLVPLVLFLVYLVLQIVPLPPAVVHFISPERYRLAVETIGFVDLPTWITLSVAPENTLREFFRFSAYACFYILTIQLLANPARMKKTLWFVVAVGAIIAIQAVLQKYLSNGRIYWLREFPAGSQPFGPYINRNHFAGYMEMVVPLALVLYLKEWPAYYGHQGTLRQRLASFFAAPSVNTHLALAVVSAIMFFSIIGSLSRGGMVSTVLSLFVFWLAIQFRPLAKKRHAWTGITLGIVIVLVVSCFGWSQVDRRFGRMFDAAGNLAEQRPLYWLDSLGIIRDYPLIGTGWGTFGNIFQTYRTILGNWVLYNAHNDYIETAVEGGIIGVVIIGWFLGDVIVTTLHGVRQRKDTFAFYLTFGSLAGVLALLIHSVTDFNFKIPANALYFFLLLGLAVSGAHTRMHHGRMHTLLRLMDWKCFRLCAVSFSSVLLLLNIAHKVSLVRAQQYGEAMEVAGWTWSDKTPKENLPVIAELAEKAVAAAPFDSSLHHRAGRVYALLGNQGKVEEHYRAAIRLNPAQATFLEDYGLFLARQGEHKTADHLFQASIRHDQAGSHRRRVYAKFLLKGEDKEKGLRLMTEVLTMYPAENEEDITLLVDSGFSDKDILQNLPARISSYLAFAEYLEKRGDINQAEMVIHSAIDLANMEPDIRAQHFYRAQAFFNRIKKDESVLAILLRGVDVLPHDPGLRVAAGNIYRKLKQPKQALECYQQALAIDPATPKVRKLIAEVEAMARDKKSN